jgi:hypothetical protein
MRAGFGGDRFQLDIFLVKLKIILISQDGLVTRKSPCGNLEAGF